MKLLFIKIDCKADFWVAEKAIQLSLYKGKGFVWKIKDKAARSLTMILAHSSISYLYSGGVEVTLLPHTYCIECISHHIHIQQGDKMAEIGVPYRHVIESRIFALNIQSTSSQSPVSNFLLYSFPSLIFFHHILLRVFLLFCLSESIFFPGQTAVLGRLSLSMCLWE